MNGLMHFEFFFLFFFKYKVFRNSVFEHPVTLIDELQISALLIQITEHIFNFM